MDKIDKKILKILSDNAKINNVELSRRINLTAPGTLQRVRRLQKNGFILGYKIILNKKKLGKGLSCFMAINLTNDTEQSADILIEKHLKRLSEIEEIHLLTGRYDCLLKVHVRDVDELRDFMLRKLMKTKACSHVETFIALSSMDNPNFSLID